MCIVMRAVTALICVVAVPAFAFAEVTKVSVTSRVTVANGQAFGNTGPYEKLTGTIEFAVDPKEPHNARITDIDRATPAADKRVHFTSDLMVIKPVDPVKGNGVLLFEVVNRGNILRRGFRLPPTNRNFMANAAHSCSSINRRRSRKSSSPTLLSSTGAGDVPRR